jgi:hypothetical protein
MSGFVERLKKHKTVPGLLSVGVRGDLVQLLLGCLRENGFGPAAWDAISTDDPLLAEFDQAVGAVVRKYQAEKKLEVDGVVGPQTWASLAGLKSWPVPDLDGASLRAKHIANLNSATKRKTFRAAGRKLTGGPNACAATASQYYMELKIIGKPQINTLALITDLKKTGKFEEIKRDKIQPGDLVVTVDDPKDSDHAPEHVWHALTANAGGFAKSADNYSDTPYIRNIGPGPKTEADYALRLKV